MAPSERMAAYGETAEEQLLRMIEGPEGPQAEPNAQAQNAPGRGPHLKGLLGRWKDRAKGLLSPKGPFQGDTLLWNLHLASRILWLILMALGVYVVVALFIVRPNVQMNQGSIPAGAEDSSSPAAPAAVENPLKPMAHYLGIVAKRNPFTGMVSMMASPAAKTTRKRIEDLVKELSLVGIDRGPNPAALIEDKSQSKTIVVSAGQELNGMKVEKITSDGVVLTYEGEEIVLR